MTMKTILLVEDDAEIRDLLSHFLRREGFAVEGAADARAMDMILARMVPALMVLDLMLPGEDGLSICRRLAGQVPFPIVMLTAKGEDVDRIIGLEIGADDYLPKPFNPRELLARIRAVLRRGERQAAAQATRRLRLFDLVVDLDGRMVETAAGERVALTSAEFDLLACLVEHPRRVLSRDQLLDWTRGRSADPFDRTIDVGISRLRRKLEAADARAAQGITTVRNGGYILSADIEGIGP
ncbi:response regulator [Zavarzinia compransoris]|uniref:response regulator n=1 Tax=Zavarzinia marina TaxID=2911065 RepID=UPI001F3F693E|nr:response regulator [Zavarzinia marina]MCF4165344.1 response regulator [Zavarzinia marina]